MLGMMVQLSLCVAASIKVTCRTTSSSQFQATEDFSTNIEHYSIVLSNPD
jgi:hypothetical protein